MPSTRRSRLNDRRRRRSDECRTAIHFQLLHLVEQYDLDNLVLADPSGLLIACARNEEVGRALAAYAPLVKRHLDRGARERVTDALGDRIPEISGSTLSIRKFELAGDAHYLCVVGEDRLSRHANLYRAVTGIRRIVDETRRRSPLDAVN